ncbi:OmpA family protein [Paragemmobacter ruber]|uniref:OmpA family protein n=1 Tax=Paragemmobacter ruber TaxID=1985673 RepID=A0ABW9Y4E8_9RHOB|nr:OmpA family protein [Rhodobacter ruber]NBE07423.1 OmpA family protein [Rhodobacter ruber]
MQRVWWCAAAVTACLVASGAWAQDVTLTARDGGLALTGTLQGWDGEFYRIETEYGALTVDGQGVICDGPGCPDLTAPRIPVRIVGEGDPGRALLPPLVAAFARARGLDHVVDGDATILTDPTTGQVLAEFSFQPMDQDSARAALMAGRAELILSAGTEPDLGSRTLALDALVPIIAADNPVAQLSSADLARALSGEVQNWSEIGGPDMPLVLHGLPATNGLQRALSGRLGRDVVASVIHPDFNTLAAAVARDPWALAVTARAVAGPARIATLTDSCGFPLLPTSLAVKAEDYPLALPLHLLTPRRRLPLMAREFLEFLNLPQAQQVIAQQGYVDRQPERQPMTADGLRLINAIQGAGAETTLADLKRLVDVMDGADRLSFTFRFEDGSSTLDAHSRTTLEDLARLLEAGGFTDETLILAGFSDGSGAAEANLSLSQTRAETVQAALQAAAPGLEADRLPQIMAFGEALPMACDETGAGRRLNRRVELWLRPDFLRSDVPPAD